MAAFYEVSQRLIDEHPTLFVKTQPHDPDDRESADLLWFELSDDPSDLCEGEVILVSKEGDHWYAEHDHADKVGGWPTVWSVSGTVEEVITAVLEYTDSE